MNKPAVAFVGVGVMGASMAGHLLAAGYSVTVSTRTKSRAEGLLARGATWAESPGEAAASADIIISIVGFPADVEEIYLHDGGILQSARPGSVVVDMTTSSPKLAIRIAENAAERDIEALDAPVSGGDVGAKEARLSIMVGGTRSAFDRVLPLFQCMGKNIVYQGTAGSGQHTKMCNQIAIAPGMLGVAEALTYAKASGLDQQTVLKSIEAGAAGSWSLSNLGPRMMAGNFDPGFYVKHFIKDLGIALESARELGIKTPGLELALTMYKRLAEMGGEEFGTQALYKLYER